MSQNVLKLIVKSPICPFDDNLTKFGPNLPTLIAKSGFNNELKNSQLIELKK